jgi:hypothetical protein
VADVWKAEVTVSAVTYTGPTTSFTVPLGDTVIAAYLFWALDPDGNAPGIQIDLFIEGGTGNLKCRETHGFAALAAAPIHITGDSATYTSAGSGLFTGGGTLSVTKDDTTSTYTWSGPSGSDSLNYSYLGGVTDGELSPDICDMHSGTASTGVFPATTVHQTIVDVPWHDFWGSKNGVHIKGANLGSTDRGSWISTFPEPLNPWAVSRSGNVTVTSPDTGTEVVGHIQSDPASGPLADGSALMFREWDQSVYLTTAGGGAAIDMTTAPEHGAIWAAFVYGASADTLRWRRSFDKGVTWAEGTLYTAGGTSNSSPNIAWQAGKLWAVWHNGTDILQSFSRDLGTTWSTPLALSITGTNPRLIVDAKHGTSFYFYIDGTDLKLVRSGNFGADMIDATPISVTAGIGAQTVAAQLASDGSLVVAYIISGTWTQKRSRDYGLTWS